MSTVRKPSTQTRFARNSREAFGAYYPIEQRRCAGDRFVAFCCVVGLVVLVVLGVMP
jgi:hypothetical protein